MMTAKLRTGIDIRIFFAAAILAAGLFVSYAIFAHAQTATSSDATAAPAAGITFPVPELGNCDSKDACRSYCRK